MELSNLPIPLSDGHWVSAKVARTVEILKEYDDKLDVVWIPPERREPGEEAFMIVELTPQGPKPIFGVESEDYMDERLLEKIFQYDTKKHGDKVLTGMDARNAARRAMIRKEHQEEMEAAHDLAHSILKSPKIRYRHNGVTYE